MCEDINMYYIDTKFGTYNSCTSDKEIIGSEFVSHSIGWIIKNVSTWLRVAFALMDVT